MPDWIREAMERADEALDPELVPYLQESEFLGQVLRHPLVYQVPFYQAFRANDQLKAKQAGLAKALAAKAWGTYIFLHERPYRASALKALLALTDGPSDKQWWELVGEVWSDTENLHEYGELTELVVTDRPSSQYMMTEGERYLLECMDDEVTVLRGYSAGDTRRGWAWTTNRKTAAFFARRFPHRGPPRVVQGKIRKERIIAVFLGRNEQEVVVRPSDVYSLRTIPVPD
jgi:hypothetical protein